jgi:hypothetical protein
VPSESKDLETKLLKISYEASKVSKEDELVMIWDSTDIISVYCFNSNKIMKEKVEDIPYEMFLENNRYINIGKKVYISGGTYEDKPCNLFIVLDRPKNTITELRDLPIKVIRQSLAAVGSNHIITVGGTNNTLCFTFSINRNQWNPIQTLNEAHEDSTVFVLNNDYVFCFGGKQNNSIDCLFESLHFNIQFECMDLSKLFWNPVKLANKAAIGTQIFEDLLYISGSGLILLENCILLCGGYNSKNSNEYRYIFSATFENRDTSFETNINRFDKVNLENSNWFPEPVFVENKGKFYNFDLDGNMTIFDKSKFTVSVNEFDFYAN